MLEEFKKLPALVQLVIVVAIAVISYLILVRITAQINATKRVQENKAEIVALQQSGVTASYTDAKYASLADVLVYTMDGAGTYEEELYDVFEQMKNDVDVIKLDAAFGVRDGADLKAWIVADLSSSERSQLNNLLANKGISRSY